jgi:tetratricopeptide (TPR) repeat protein
MSSRVWLIVAAVFLLATFAPVAVMWATMPTLPELLPPITPDSPIGVVLREGREAKAAHDDKLAIERYTTFLDSQSKPNWYSSVVLRERAAVYEKLEQYDRAEADLTAAIKASPISHSIYAERGAFYGRRHRDNDALADFRTGARLDPRSGRYAYTEALLREERSDYEGAIEQLNDAIRIEPNVRKYYAERGSAHNYAAKYADARADYDKALQMADKNASPRDLALANLGRGYASLHLGVFQQAVDDFDVVLKVVSKASNALAWRGKAHQGLGDIEQARADYKAALAIDPKQSSAIEGLKALEPAQQ